MARIAPLDHATGRSGQLLDDVRRKIGCVPILMRMLAHSPVALEGYLSLRDTLASGALPVRLREQIAITVAARNGCNICLVNHSRYGRAAGLADEDIAAAEHGTAADPRSAAALVFARMLLDTRGYVPDSDISIVRGAGFNDAAIIEIAATVALNVFANAVNNLAAK